MSLDATAILLAAGKSTRMKSRLPKVLHEVCGKPMLEFVLKACFDAGCRQVVTVVGHGKNEVKARFQQEDQQGRIVWVEQNEQLGTGHAAKMCLEVLQKQSGDVFILAGDGPLITGSVLKALRHAHHEAHADASMATAILDDPTGYGRIVRDAKGEFMEIVEQLDCTPRQREIKEVFPSIYCVKAEALVFALLRLKNENKKGEFYLTDIYGILRQSGRKVLAVQTVTAQDVLAVNSRDQQAQVDSLMQERIQSELRANGVSIPSAANTYVEAGVMVGADTTIQPFSFIGRDSSIGANCTIGPFAVIPRETLVPDGSSIAGNVSPETAGLM